MKLPSVVFTILFTLPCFAQSLLSQQDHLRLRNKVAPAIVLVHNSKGQGTAFFVKNDAGKIFLITNNHVCGNEKTIYIYNFAATVLHTSPTFDLCSIKLGGPVRDSSVLALSKSAPAIGDLIYALGHPRAFPLTMTGGEVTFYLPDAEVSPGTKYTVIFTTVVAFPGSSGSPFVDINGDVVGVLAGTMKTVGDWATGISLKNLKEFMEEAP